MQENKYSIKHWSKDDRPREKLLATGAENLSNAELLAILIHNGTRSQSAVDLARQVMKLGRNNLLELGKLSVRDLMKVKGIGAAKAITISAALELGRRRQGADSLHRMVVTASTDTATYLQDRLKDQQREVFGVIFLNRANRIIHFGILSEGGLTATVVDPRIVLRKALEENAVGIILFHNHPSGSLRPSQADQAITARIKQAAALFDIAVLDHIIVSDEGYYSFADEGKM